MSYEIVKGIHIEEVDGEYIAKVNSACNNVTPRYYSTWNYGKGNKYTKEELIKEVLLDFLHGNLQGGNSRFRKVVKVAESRGALKRYYKLYRIHSKALSLYYRTPKENEQRRKHFENKNDKFYTLAINEAKNALYAVYNMKNSTKQPPFRLKVKGSSYWVTKLTSRRYHYTGSINEAKIYNSVLMYERIKSSPSLSELFEIVPLLYY